MEKNHKTAVMFLTYLKLILGTERVYSLKKKNKHRKSKKKTNQVKQRQTKSNKDDMSKGKMI